MRYPPDHKEQVRPRIVEAAGRRFRQLGYEGASAGDLMAAAGLTTGALYTQFRSKRDLMLEVMAVGLTRVAERFRMLRERDPAGWFAKLVSSYLSREHRNRIAEGCALPTLSVDAGRLGAGAQRVYADGIERTAGILCGGDVAQRDNALATLALFTGGIVLARAVPDGALSEEILAACRKAALALPPG
jgi:TetR/AcrR family transcriptional regulator, transcriptional repressor for nem operon